MSFEKIDQLCRKLEALEHSLAILGADEATHMAVGGGEKRAEAMSNLAGMYHAQATAPHIADWINDARNEDLSADPVIAEIRLEAQLLVRLHRVIPLILKLIGPELVGEPDTPPLLAHVEEHASAFRGNQGKGPIHLWAAITAQ